jgi:DNA polymerase I-like protein with 3'-5' exonuclease and polymerase domains
LDGGDGSPVVDDCGIADDRFEPFIDVPASFNLSPTTMPVVSRLFAQVRKRRVISRNSNRDTTLAPINAPIQGAAADIIRRAMVRMDDALEKAKLSANMLLQVHDELVFVVPDSEVAATIEVVRKVMVDAPHPYLQLAVPLQVDAKAAHNWGDAH